MRITVQKASEMLGCDVVTVREMLKKEGCPIGMAYKADGHSRWTYVIYPKAFNWLVGEMKGEQDEKVNNDNRITVDDQCR